MSNKGQANEAAAAALGGAATGTELATAMQRGETAINGLQRELREVTGTLTMADKAAGLFKPGMTVDQVASRAQAYVAAWKALG